MASASAKKIRPKYLSLSALLFEIRLPVPGWVSILHRISGAWLFFPFVAWLLYLLDKSLQSEQGFQYVPPKDRSQKVLEVLVAHAGLR